MIKCIAIDDEPLALEQLVGYISRVPFLQLIASCQDAFGAMQVLSEEEVDLMFVDIHMPDLNGLDLVRSLVVKPLIVFTTAYPEYAVEGFKVDAVDYLLKPFEFQDLLKAADKARGRGGIGFAGTGRFVVCEVRIQNHPYQCGGYLLYRRHE